MMHSPEAEGKDVSQADLPPASRHTRLIRGRRHKIAELTERLAREHEQRKRLSAELGELRRSYYLSGMRKKIDISSIPGFSSLAQTVMDEQRTGMNFDRFYMLWQAVLAAPADGAFVEIGTYKGGSARFISETLSAVGRQPRFFVCDTFAGHPHTDPVDAGHHHAGKFMNTSAEAVREYLASYPALELVVGDIEETSPRLADEQVAFVHLDVDVYRATGFSLRFFAPRLIPGAVILVDDYGFTTCPGAKQAVDEFCAEQPEFQLLHLLTGQALLLRRASVG